LLTWRDIATFLQSAFFDHHHPQHSNATNGVTNGVNGTVTLSLGDGKLDPLLRKLGGVEPPAIPALSTKSIGDRSSSITPSSSRGHATKRESLVGMDDLSRFIRPRYDRALILHQTLPLSYINMSCVQV
jgi:hypothetical protein